jgi:hypothetical protein
MASPFLHRLGGGGGFGYRGMPHNRMFQFSSAYAGPATLITSSARPSSHHSYPSFME